MHGQTVMPEPDLAALAARFDGPAVTAMALMGSFARGDAGPFSDVDLLRVGHGDAKPEGDGSYLVDGRLVVVSSRTQEALEEMFEAPDAACTWVQGLRAAKPLVDREGVLARLQQRAREFVWDAAMQARADRYAGEQLVGWIEEVHKGLEGLRRHDVGRLLNARFGLSWGLSGVVQVQRGVLLTGDNGMWDEINRAVGDDSRWVALRRAAFGLEMDSGPPLALVDQVRAGLALYAETVGLMEAALQEPERSLILATVARIRVALEDRGMKRRRGCA